MKIIICLLLSINLYANYSQQDICEFKKVIANGWTDTNQTLNQKIISQEKTAIPNIIAKLNQPLTPDENKSSIYPFPKFELHRDDYIKLFAYSKYLESQHNTADIIKIYTKAYRGLTHIKMSSYLPFIYFIALNQEISKSLSSSFRHHIFTTEEKNTLHKNISSLLVTDNKKLFDALKAENNIALHFVDTTTKIDGDYILDKKHLNLFKKQWKVALKKDYKTIIEHLNKDDIDTIITKKQKGRNDISIMTYLKMMVLKYKIKFYNLLSINIDKSDYLSFTDYTIKNDLLRNTPAIYRTIKDYFELKENNKQLLRELKENQ